jgi:hypothetical protein
VSGWSERLAVAHERVQDELRRDPTPWGKPKPRALQLQLGDMGPTPGEVVRNVHTGELATVMGVGQRKYCWVVLRYREGEREQRLADFYDHWAPMAPATL